MKKTGLSQVVDAINKADEQNDPALIFTTVSEQVIWPHVKSILDDPEQNYLLGPILIEAINAAFAKLKNFEEILNSLYLALRLTNDSLVYKAAQRTILNQVEKWNDRKLLRQFFEIFKKNYLEITDRGGDSFMAEISLEGAVMLSILRPNGGLNYAALDLLFTNFPPVPNDPEDSALLAVKAIKLLGYCYDHDPNNKDIVAKIKELVGHVNRAVDTEARFTLGIINLYSAFQAQDQPSFLTALMEANEAFRIAANSEENRSDSELFSAITHCYWILVTTGNKEELSEVLRKSQKILVERLLSFGGADLDYYGDVESALVNMVVYLESCEEILEDATRWVDLRPPLKLLAEVYTTLRLLEVDKNLTKSAARASRETVMLPLIHGRFVQVQEITAKLENILSEPDLIQTMSPSVVDFYRLVVEKIADENSPKDFAANELERIRSAALQDNSGLAQLILNDFLSGKDSTQTLIEIAWKFIELNRTIEKASPEIESPANDILKRIVPDLKRRLDKRLGWEPPSVRWIYLTHALRFSVKYLVKLFRTTPGEATPTNVFFLFSKNVRNKQGQGLGTDAKEIHLETHFYETAYFEDWVGVVRKQPVSGAPGRPDLMFEFPGGIMFPIETKCEDSNISRESISKKYLSQGQYYAAGTFGVSFLLVLDLTPKERGIPPMNIVNYCYVDERPALGKEATTDCVVVLIFYANRLRPSDHSHA